MNIEFYLAEERPCPYLPNRLERKLFAFLDDERGDALHNNLAQKGFRRSQNIAYMPACVSCAACTSARVKAQKFAPSRSQRRVLKKNKDLMRDVRPTTDIPGGLYALFQRYVAYRHADGDMAQMTEAEFQEMVQVSPVETRLVTYTQGDTYVASCLVDVMEDGVSLVYSFFDPYLSRNSLGTFMILDLITYCATELQYPHVYLGYAVRNSPKMQYKFNFQPLEIFHNGMWSDLTPTSFARTPG